MKKFKNIKEVQQMFTRLASKSITKKHLRHMAQIAKKERIDNLKRGLDVDGNAMKPLSDRQKRYKEKKGSEFPYTPMIDEQVMNNLNITVGDTFVKLSIPKSREKISEYHMKGMGKNPVRKHFGFTDDAIMKINRYFTNQMMKIYKAIFNGK